MATKEKISVNPTVLRWARSTAGLSLEEASRAIGLNGAFGLNGAERLAALEEGEDQPSRPLLLKMAKAYRRPLLAFYLPEPPKLGDRGEDFRTVPNAAPPVFNPNLDALLRDVKARHGIVKSLQEDVEAEPVGFIGSVTRAVPVPELALMVAEKIGFVRAVFHQCKTIEAAFGYLRSRVEGSGVFVVLLGNLGSFHSNIAADVFRGFAIADPTAPFIVVNDQDAKTAWSFTVLHELIHLWLGATGVSGGDNNSAIERYCNDVASEILVSSAEVSALRDLAGRPIETLLGEISGFARARNVSRDLVCYRAMRAGFVSPDTWQLVRARFRQEWLEAKGIQAAKQKQADSGPNYYVVRRHKLGLPLLSLVDNSLREGNLSYTKAGKVLGVKPRNVEPLLQSAGRGS